MFFNLTNVTRWAVQRTIFYSAPFYFVLAIYAVWRDQRNRTMLTVMSLPFLATVIVYIMQSEGSGSMNGERYYFEPFCLVSIVAARGDPGPADRAAWAKRFGESSWTVMGFDWDRDQVTMEEGCTQ
ncbi:MAG TPA: hypothetical protein VKE70_37750 [Candidatus Solibacter sp.]|nr:hypothetical protein [Candidatus Solibacter sp.]